MNNDELMAAARDMQAPYDLVKEVHDTGALPVVNFAGRRHRDPVGTQRS